MAYRKSTGTFKSTNGKDRIRYYIYEPQQEIRAIIQISHGMCEYLEVYEEIIKDLTAKGILVCGNDHLGHGASVASSEDFGYFGEKDGWEYLVRDLKKLNYHMKKKYPNVPYYLLGHSMGSFVARIYTVYYGDTIDGAIYMGTSGTVPAARLGRMAVKMYRGKKDGHHRSQAIQNLVFGTYNERYKEEQDAFSWLCHDESFRKRYITEERHRFIFTLAGFEDLFTMLDFVSSKKWYAKLPKKLPYLLLAGEEDPVGQYGKGVKEVYEKMAVAGCHNLTIKLYEGQRHVLFKEEVKEDAVEQILQFIKKQTA